AVSESPNRDSLRPLPRLSGLTPAERARASSDGEARRMESLTRAVLGAVLLASGPSWASEFVVNSTADAVDAKPGDGVCATSSGVCTLRAAIQEANAHSGKDSITLPAGTYTLSIAGPAEDAAATGDLDITDDLILNGAGAETTIVDGAQLD